MPQDTPLSLTVANARKTLLREFQQVLSAPVKDPLRKNLVNREFVHIDEDAPQVAAIKKFLNSLEHATRALKAYESIDTSTYLAKVASVPKVVSALKSVYQALALLNDASPEIQRLIMENYALLAPVLQGANALIQSSGWVAQFQAMPVVEAANQLVGVGASVVVEEGHSLTTVKQRIVDFSAMPAALMLLSESRKRTLTSEEWHQCRSDINRFMAVFESEAYATFDETLKTEGMAAISALAAWMKEVSEHPEEKSQQLGEYYDTWCQRYLASLLVLLDETETQHYLKPGFLTDAVIKEATGLSKEIKKPLPDITTRRVSALEVKQLKVVQNQAKLLDDKADIGRYFTIISQYKGQNLSDISAEDRQELRQLHPGVQVALAEVDVDVENKLAAFLNQQDMPPIKTASSLVSRIGAMFTGLVVTQEVDALLSMEASVDKVISKQLEAVNLEGDILKVARKHLTEKPFDAPEIILPRRIALQPGDLTPIASSSIRNIRGNLAYLQSLHLSQQVSSLQTYLDPYLDNEDIQTLDKAMTQLATALKTFEDMGSNQSLVQKTQALLTIGASAYQLKQSLNALSQSSDEVLQPVRQSINALAKSLVNVNDRAPQLAEVKAATLLVEKKQSVLLSETLHHTQAQLKARLTQHLSPVFIKALEDKTQTPPPDVLAVRQILESLAQAEEAIRVAETLKKSKTLGRFETAQLSIKAYSSAYQSLMLLSEASPEVIRLIQDNKDLLEPVINDVYQYIETSGWMPQLKANMTSQNMGAILGQGINLFKPTEGQTNQYEIAARLMTKLPQHLQWASQVIEASDDNKTMPAPPLSDKEIQDMAKLFESFSKGETRVLGNAKGMIALFKLAQAVKSGKKELVPALFKEYQAWSEQELPGFIAGLDALETRNYLRPGTLSAPIIDELKKIHSKMKHIEPMPSMLSMAMKREQYLAQALVSHESAILSIEAKQNAVAMLTEGLADYKGKEAREIPDEVILKLKSSYALLQKDLAVEDLEGTNAWVDAFNLDKKEASVARVDELLRLLPAIEADLSKSMAHEQLSKAVIAAQISSIRLQDKGVEPFVYHDVGEIHDEKALLWVQKQTLTQQYQLYNNFRRELREQGTHYGNSTTAGVALFYRSVQSMFFDYSEELDEDVVAALKNNSPSDALRLLNFADLDTYYKDEMISIDKALDDLSQKDEAVRRLAPVRVETLNTLRGNVAYLQSLKLSEQMGRLSGHFDAITARYFSAHVNDYLVKKAGDTHYTVNPEDPSQVQQIKDIHNALVEMQVALQTFETLSQKDKLATNARALANISLSAYRLQQSLDSLSTSLKVHYGPLVNESLAYAGVLADVNAKNFAEKKEIMSELHGLSIATTASFGQDDGGISGLNERAFQSAKLATRVAHQASPVLEKISTQLQAHYQGLLTKSNAPLVGLTREQLQNNDFMQEREDALLASLNRFSTLDIESAWALRASFRQLFQQMSRANSEAVEIGGMVHTLSTLHINTLKKEMYDEVIARLSTQEDNLGLKAGTLCEPALLSLNQMMVSAMVELDMPFEQKLQVYNDHVFMDDWVKKTRQERDDLKLKTPTPDNMLALKIKEDKLLYLETLQKQFSLAWPHAKGLLLDAEFERIHESMMKDSQLKEPLQSQYAEMLQQRYHIIRPSMLSATEPKVESLKASLDEVKQQHHHQFVIVEKATHKITEFTQTLNADKYGETKTYLQDLSAKLSNGSMPIGVRYGRTMGLPDESEFKEKILKAPLGLGFFNKFKYFVERATFAVSEALSKGVNFFEAYRQKKVEQKIEAVTHMKAFKKSLSELKVDITSKTDEEKTSPSISSRED